jgi:hypothetical protein
MVGYEVILSDICAVRAEECNGPINEDETRQSVRKCSLAMGFVTLSHAVQSGCIALRGRHSRKKKMII